MAAAAHGAGGNAGKDDGVRRRMSRAELVKRWEDVFDSVGDGDEAMELFMALLLRDARAEHAHQSRKEQQEEEERRARVFVPWQPPPPGSSAPPPPPLQPPMPRLERTVVLGLRAPPHLMPRPRKHERTTPTPTPPSAPAADLGTRGGV